MYELLINIEGKNYYPARAIQRATAGYISPQGTVKLLSDRDTYFRARSYRYIAGTGAVEELDSDVWLSVTAGKEEELPAGVLVAEDDLRHAWFVCFCDPEAVFQRHPEDPVPDEERLPLRKVLMTPAEYKVLMEGMPKRGTLKQRSNSHALRLEKLTEVFANLQARARAAGMDLDARCIPGIKSQLQTCLASIDSTIGAMALATFHGYVKELGWGWRRGARPEHGAAFFAAVTKVKSKK